MEFSQDRQSTYTKDVLYREEPENQISSEEVCGFEFNEIFEEISVSEPMLGEVKEAIEGLKNGKAPEIDSITAELLKPNVEFSAEKIHRSMTKIWNHERIPEAWKLGLIVKLPKKGNVKECKNSRGIMLLSVVGKILGRIIIDRIRKVVDRQLINPFTPKPA